MRAAFFCFACVTTVAACGDDTITTGGGGSGGSGGAPATGGAGGGEAGSDVGGASACEASTDPIPELQLVPFVDGLTRPIHMVPDPTRPGRYFVSERIGRIRVVEDGELLDEPFLDISTDVSCCENDRGFFAIALHPNYAENGLYYVHYSHVDTPSDSTTVLAEYHRSDVDPVLSDPEPVRTLLELAQTTVWHYGGSIMFGSDGMLYYSRGDGGGEGDPEDDAQNRMNKLGKILRIDVDTYPEPPEGNMPDADPFVWDMGLRNAWRMSFDRCNGDLYLGDVGQSSYEEISVSPASEEHVNFGWAMYEGTSCFKEPCDPEGITMPVVTHAHNTGFCAIIGGYVYRGEAIPELRGRYFYGDICSRRVMSFVYSGGEATDQLEHTLDLESDEILSEYGFGSFAEDEAGELYLLDMEAGSIFRIERE